MERIINSLPETPFYTIWVGEIKVARNNSNVWTHILQEGDGILVYEADGKMNVGYCHDRPTHVITTVWGKLHDTCLSISAMNIKTGELCKIKI